MPPRQRPFCLQAGLPDSGILNEAIATVQTKVQTLAEVPDKIRFFFHLSMDPEALAKVQPEAVELLSNWRTGWNGNRYGTVMNLSAY